MSDTLHSTHSDGTINETTITAEPAAVLAAGGQTTYTYATSWLLMDEQRQIIPSDSALPQTRDEAS